MLIIFFATKPNTEKFEEQVADKVPPPNVYTNPNIAYSHETIMANLSDIRKTLEQYQLKA
jgi:hypothetical protein